MGALIGIIAGGVGAYMIAPYAAAMASAKAAEIAQRRQVDAQRAYERRFQSKGEE